MRKRAFSFVRYAAAVVILTGIAFAIYQFVKPGDSIEANLATNQSEAVTNDTNQSSVQDNAVADTKATEQPTVSTQQPIANFTPTKRREASSTPTYQGEAYPD